LVATGLARSFSNQGLDVAVFKKGPDFIDSAWLGTAAKAQAHNLDTFLAAPLEAVRSLQKQAASAIAVVEGNRGLFDGFDAHGTHSTAELAKLIQAPVVLVIDATKSTRTIAALVLGCRALDPELQLGGIILNRVGTVRQERLIRDALALVCDVRVIGAIPRLPDEHLPSRHLGLVLPAERKDSEQVLQAMADVVTKHVDLMSVRHLAAQAPALHADDESSAPHNASGAPTTSIGAVSGTLDALATDAPAPPASASGATRIGYASSNSPVRVGVLRDAAFCFYYPENLSALETAGATLVPISPLADERLPAIDALYAGGGYPELFARELSENDRFRTALAERIHQGLPVWAECGGLMYLTRAIEHDGNRFPMLGVLPFVAEHTRRPQAHGYVEAVVDVVNPFLAIGTRLRGHEFHHSRLIEPANGVRTALALERGVGISERRDGAVVGRVFASYLHLFAPGVPDWARSVVRVARQVQRGPTQQSCFLDRGEQYDKYSSGRSRDRSGRGWVHSGARQVE
jgi:cobyrinic acid a,c-diamide synthase